MAHATTHLLLADGKISIEALAHAAWVSSEAAEPVEFVLVKLGLVSETDIAYVFAKALGFPLVSLENLPEPLLRLRDLSPKFLRRFQVFPTEVVADRLRLAMAYPLDEYAADAIALLTGRAIERATAVSPRI